MAKIDKYSILDFRQDFPNHDTCLQYLFDRQHSRLCSCGGKYERIKGRQQFQCSKCRFQIAPKAGTIFEKSVTPLTSWFHAIWLFSNAKTGMSAKELERQLGVTYKCAWRILKLIRQSLTQNTDKLTGDVEMDETYFGGHKKGGRYNKNQSQVMKSKTAIVGAVERKGVVKADVTANLSADTLGVFLDKNVSAKNTRLLTDESNRYDSVAWHYNRQKVNHKREEWARGDVHTNTIEGFWSHVKRSIDGTHKAISRKYLASYLDGFVWHYNNRGNDRARFASLLTVLAG